MSPSRIRTSVVSDKAQAVERMLAGVRSLPLGSEAELVADPRMVAAGESFLRRGLEALFDLGRHVLAKGFGDPVTEYKAIAQRLGELGVLDPEQTERLRTMAGYRNRLVHSAPRPGGARRAAGTALPESRSSAPRTEPGQGSRRLPG